MSAERVGWGGGGGGGGGGVQTAWPCLASAIEALVSTGGHFCQVFPSHLHSVGVVRVTEVLSEWLK